MSADIAIIVDLAESTRRVHAFQTRQIQINLHMAEIERQKAELDRQRAELDRESHDLAPQIQAELQARALLIQDLDYVINIPEPRSKCIF